MRRHRSTTLFLIVLLICAVSAGARTKPLRGTSQQRLLELASKSQKIVVIVGVRVPDGWNAADTKNPVKAAKQRQRAREAKEKILRSHPTAHKVKDRDFEFIPYFTLEVNEHALRGLLNDDDVTSIEENVAGERALIQSTSIVGSATANSSGYTGNGQTVVVIDDGVQSTHPFFGTRVVQSDAACFNTPDGNGDTLCPGNGTSVTGTGAGEPCSSAYGDTCDHGTQVAGIVAGQHSTNTSFFGVAPAAKILPIQVYSYSGNSNPGQQTKIWLSDFLAALAHVDSIRGSHTIAAVNLSLVLGSVYTSESACISAYSSVDSAVSTLHANGIAVVAASGNKASSAAANRWAPPACMTNAISVGATTDTDVIGDYSYVPTNLDLFAPGGTSVTNYGINTSKPVSTYIESYGTSFAAPHVAGAFAVLRHAAPGATVSKILSDLKTTGEPIEISTGVYVPRINVNDALNADTVAPATPGTFAATGSSTGVVLTWQTSLDNVPGPITYEISRRATRTGTFVVVDEVIDDVEFTDSTVSASKMYEYRIVAVDESGNRSTQSTDYAVTVSFTDNLVDTNSRAIKGIHVAELRNAVDSWREFALLSRLHSTYPAATGSVLATHFSGSSTSLVNALNDARTAMSLSSFSYSGVSAPATQGAVRKEHVLQLRTSMN